MSQELRLDVATTLAECKIFQTSDRFWLFDAVLSDSIPSEDVNIVFNEFLSPLLVKIDGLEKSCLYRHLLKRDAGLDQLLKLLSDQKINAIAHLPTLAALTGMSAMQQNAFYLSFLETLQPTFEQAKGLLETFIRKENLLSAHQDTQQRLATTLAWFTTAQPELSSLLSEMQQNLQSWQCLMRLAKLLRDRLETQMIYADDLVEHYGLTTLIQPAMCDWLACISKGEVASSVFQANSQIWKSLQSGDIEAIALSQPQLTAPLISELIQANRYSDIGGSLLHQLICQWEAGEPVDESLLALIGNPAVTKTYSEEDWCAIPRICWNPDIQGWLTSRPLHELSEHSRMRLIQQATEIIRACDNSQWIERLLTDCSAWRLNLEERRKILAVANPKACKTALVRGYLSDANSPLDLSQARLISLLLQTKPTTFEEQEMYNEVQSLHCFRQIETNNYLWAKKLSSSDRDIYRSAIYSIIEGKLPRH